jgi:cytochrome b subunit of formate dehydrogenase
VCDLGIHASLDAYLGVVMYIHIYITYLGRARQMGMHVRGLIERISTTTAATDSGEGGFSPTLAPGQGWRCH